MTLYEAFINGKVEGVAGIPDATLTAYLSWIFLINNRAYKVYRRDNDPFFDDEFGDVERRRAFYRDDFEWNHAVSPAIYHKLGHLRQTKNGWEQCTADDAIGWYIEMERLDPNRELTEMLRARSWLANSCEICQPGGGACSGIEHHQYFDNGQCLELILDGATDNIFQWKEALYFTDVMYPKPRWRFFDIQLPVSCIGADCHALGGREARKVFYQGYDSESNEKCDPTIRVLYELSNALLRGYFAQLRNRHKIFKKYESMIEHALAELE